MSGTVMVLPRDGRKDEAGKPPKYDRIYYVGQNEFFVLSQKEVRRTSEAELKRLGRSKDYSMPGLSWPCVQAFKDKWNTLPD